MAKITMEIESRCLYSSNDERDVSELFELTGLCEYADDAESGNDFDINIRSDLDRFKTTVACDTAEQAQSDQTETEIIGTRTKDISDLYTQFTRTTGTWGVNALSGYRALVYNVSTPDSGNWYNISSNTATVITFEGESVLVSGINRIKLQARTKIRHHIQLTPRCDFYGSFYQYKVTKQVSSVDGKFKWFGVKGSVLPRNVDPEFFAGMGANSNGWET
jgi:hypothetical protein